MVVWHADEVDGLVLAVQGRVDVLGQPLGGRELAWGDGKVSEK